jgi:starch synthase
MTQATRRAVEAFMRPASWRILQRNAMRADFTWHAAVVRYVALYQSLCGARPTRANVTKVRTTPRRQVAANDRREHVAGAMGGVAAAEQLTA